MEKSKIELARYYLNIDDLRNSILHITQWAKDNRVASKEYLIKKFEDNLSELNHYIQISNDINPLLKTIFKQNIEFDSVFELTQKVNDLTQIINNYKNFIKFNLDILLTELESKENKLLFLASNPKNTPNLNLSEERHSIVSDFTRNNINIEVLSEWNTSRKSLTASLFKYKPKIVHISAHATGDNSNEENKFRAIQPINFTDSRPKIILEEEVTGNCEPIDIDGFSELFRIAQSKTNNFIKVVFLNVCNSSEFAKKISENKIFAIGMSHPIRDNLAISFATDFYQILSLGGYDVETAFKAALINLRKDSYIPKLYFEGKEFF